MGITSAIVLFAVIWFMVLFIVLPLGLQTQTEAVRLCRARRALRLRT